MKRIHIRKPDIKGFFVKVRNLKKEDIKRHFKEKKERRQKILEERRNSEFARRMQPVYKWMNRLSLPLHFLLACVINFLIEVVSRLSLFEAWDYMVGTPLVFLYNAFLIFATFSIVYLVRRRTFVRILLSVFWLFLGTCNGYLLTKRVTPFNAQDLKVLSDALELTNNYFNTFELVMIIIGVVALILWIVSMWRRGGQFTGKMHRVIALGGVAASFALCIVLTDMAVDRRVISNYFGNIAFAYEDYGFPYCFSASLFNTGINEPSGYSEEMMAKISNDGEITKNETGRSEDELPNIIFVQLESFFDPTEVEWLRFSEDPIPNLRKLFSEYSTGYFKVPSVGAGTANTEFEVLTGMSMRFFGPGEYPYKTYAKTNVLESAATALTSLGYGAEALHNNGGNFYSRAQVFNNMGFDHYTSKEFMNILQTTPKGWATDDILVPNIMESMDTTEGQDFVFTISVQGHGDYPTEPTLENPEIIVSGVEDEGKRNAWEYYVNEVHEMDKFVGQLIEAVESRDEPSVIVFYGDHLPTMDLEAKDLKSRYLYNTNYVIWDNIGLEKKDSNLAAYQIMADVFERLDIHSGTVFNYHQQRRQSKDYLADLELLQYDIMYGEQYVYEESGAPITEGHMVMGVKDAHITDLVAQSDGTYSVYGDNFTKQSKVYINGEKQTTKFLNNTRLDLRESELSDGDTVMVAQVGSSNTIFRTSKTYEYREGTLTELPDDPNAVENGRQAFVSAEEEQQE
ncbi:MAG TPA: LTA synthase family protein [Candidatus Mediterraneibacter intestinavium]|nr:LTA synthase family protein [Candidatus Mediterraneibacter intestinavium]